MAGENFTARNRVPSPSRRRRGEDGIRAATPHDALFRALVSDPGRASALLRDHLPARIAARLAETPPRPLHGSFVDEALRSSQSDMLFEVDLASGGPAFVYLLVEHKSRPDPGLPLQLAGYMVRIWMRYARGRADRLRALPPIIPTVFYHGSRRWAVPSGLTEMIAAEDPELVFLPGERYIARMLSALAAEELSRDRELRAGLIALTLRAIDNFAEVVEGLRGDTALQKQVFEYIVSTYREADLDALRAKLREAGAAEMEATMGTIAEALMEKGRAEGEARGRAEGEARGRAEGEARGRAEGKAETFLRLAGVKFGGVPEHRIKEVRSASAGQLDTWLEALIRESDIEAVFDGRTRR